MPKNCKLFFVLTYPKISHHYSHFFTSDPISILSGEEYEGQLSFLLLILPHLNRTKEAISLLVKHLPSACLYYGLLYCKQPIDWSYMLNQLLSQTPSKTYFSQREQESRQVYESIMQYLAEQLDPITYLRDIIPGNGNLAFFLPFIEKNYCHYQSGLLKQSIETDTLNEERQRSSNSSSSSSSSSSWLNTNRSIYWFAHKRRCIIFIFDVRRSR